MPVTSPPLPPPPIVINVTSVDSITSPCTSKQVTFSPARSRHATTTPCSNSEIVKPVTAPVPREVNERPHSARKRRQITNTNLPLPCKRNRRSRYLGEFVILSLH